MMRGLKKIKQKSAYTFSKTSKSSRNKSLLTEILEALIKISLKPIVTICEQVITNVKVLNTLL